MCYESVFSRVNTLVCKMMFKKEEDGTALTLNGIMFFVSLFFIIFKGISMDKDVLVPFYGQVSAEKKNAKRVKIWKIWSVNYTNLN